MRRLEKERVAEEKAEKERQEQLIIKKAAKCDQGKNKDDEFNCKWTDESIRC